MAGIFLSHSSKDKSQVLRLASDLVYRGFPVWLDSWEMEIGDPFSQRIFEGIDSSTLLIVVLTPNAIASEWVKRELSAALAKEKQLGRKVVLPIKLVECDLPPEIANRIYADFSGSYLSGLETLEKVLQRAGASGIGVSLEKQLIPLRFTRGINLQETPLQNLYEALLPQLRKGERLLPSQFVVVPDLAYDSSRSSFIAFLEDFAHHPHYSAEREDHFSNRYEWIRKGEDALLAGAAAIGNGLFETNEWGFFSMAMHWLARLLRNELLAMMDEARLFRGDPPLDGMETPLRGVLNFDAVAAKFYKISEVMSCDVFHRETNRYIRVWVDATSEVGRWFSDHPQSPVEIMTFWSATLMYEFIIPQMVVRHYWNDPSTPVTWDFHGWMIGAA